MSAATVRAAVQSWIAGGNLPGLAAVYKAQPWWVDGGTWQLDQQFGGAPKGTGAVAFIHLTERSESRITVPALTGQKSRVHKVALVVLYQYVIQSATFTAPAEDDWVAELDALLDGIVARIETDPTLGTAGNPIFQAGQDPDDDAIISDLPRRDGGLILSWNVVEFHVTEIVNA